MPLNLMGIFLGLILILIILSFLRDTLNRTIYRYLLFIFRNQKLATLLYALLFLPGVALHEISHWIMAKILFVKTYHLSLVPEWVEDGNIRFGYVEINKVDRFRSAIIALAPLLSGVSIVLWLAFTHLRLDIVLHGLIALNWMSVEEGLSTFFRTPDLLIWMYLIFAISNTMLPSPTDRKAWLPIAIIFGSILVIVIIISAGSATSSWLVTNAKSVAETLLQAFSIAVVLNLCLLAPLLLLERLLMRRRKFLPSI
jgi:hypothetical protein